jgi:hypothetical protein
MTEDERQPMGLDLALGQLEVGPADGAGADPDEELTGSGNRVSHPGEAEGPVGDRSGSVEDEDLHGPDDTPSTAARRPGS